MPKPKILVFASGTKDSGGSGFQELVENSKTGVLKADIVAVVSNHQHGGVRKIAEKCGVFFSYMTEFDAVNYRMEVKSHYPDLVCLSGWLKLVKGLNPAMVINIHPGQLPDFGGPGMFGHHVHQAVIAAFKRDQVVESAVCMHFVTEPKGKDDYDKGPVFFRYPVLIRPDDTPETLAARVNKIEHAWQSWATNLVVQGKIRLVGHQVSVPDWYPFL